MVASGARKSLSSELAGAPLVADSDALTKADDVIGLQSGEMLVPLLVAEAAIREHVT
jgi:hypothetical protein